MSLIIRVLITGAAGFAAHHVVPALRAQGMCELVGAAYSGEAAPGFDDTARLDVTETDSVARLIARIQPTHVLHLAGIAAPQTANQDPNLAWRVNTLGALALGRAILAAAPETILLHVGSGAAYGLSGHHRARLDEEAPFAPGDEYGASKAAADLGLGALARRGLKVVRLRPFNHTGPGQSVDYAIPAFAMQIAAIERGQRPPILTVGNLDAERDFCDVRDVAAAYARAALMAWQDGIPSGRAYNLCSGRGVSMRAALDLLLSMSSARIEVRQDDARLRPADIARLVGDPSRAQAELGWWAKIAFEDTLRTVLERFRHLPSPRAHDPSLTS